MTLQGKLRSSWAVGFGTQVTSPERAKAGIGLLRKPVVKRLRK